jgi:hypothetical protein
MNLDGYKRKKKQMIRSLKAEKAQRHSNFAKIRHLEKSIRDCGNRISALTKVEHRKCISSKHNNMVKVKPKSKRQLHKKKRK